MVAKKDEAEGLIDIRFILLIWLKWGWLALLLVPIALYQGYQGLQAFQPVYRANMIVQPSSDNTPGVVTSGLLSGLNLNVSASTSEFARLKVLLASPRLAARLQEKYGLMQVVFASSWDGETQDWILPSGEEFERQQKYDSFFRKNPWSAPNLESLARYVAASIEFSPLPDTGFIRISFQHDDADFAVHFLGRVYSEADELLRVEDRVETSKRMAYLESQLGQTNVVTFRQSFNNLLAMEQRKAMLLNSDLPYAARIIEPPRTSRIRTVPNLRQTFGFRIFVALAVGFFMITLVAVLRRG